MGMKLGKRVVLGSGFAQVVDPDMIHIENGATINAMYQAHTFEDRVLKIDHVHVRRRATLGASTVPLYGAEIGEHAHVAAHSVIMKRERLLPGRRYEGAPTR
jgi:serine acetyltransferase